MYIKSMTVVADDGTEGKLIHIENTDLAMIQWDEVRDWQEEGLDRITRECFGDFLDNPPFHYFDIEDYMPKQQYQVEVVQTFVLDAVSEERAQEIIEGATELSSDETTDAIEYVKLDNIKVKEVDLSV